MGDSVDICTHGNILERVIDLSVLTLGYRNSDSQE